MAQALTHRSAPTATLFREICPGSGPYIYRMEGKIFSKILQISIDRIISYMLDYQRPEAIPGRGSNRKQHQEYS